METYYDCIIIGGGQAGLSVAYFLKRTNVNHIILDEQPKSGGAWRNTWDSLKLFSPTEYCSLSGWQMPKGAHEYPTKNEFLQYLSAYEERYNFPVQRATEIYAVVKEKEGFRLETSKGIYHCKALVSATGTAKNPFIPNYPGKDLYEGIQIHSVAYRNPEPFKGKKVMVVGGGNSGAQLLVEIDKVTSTRWVTLKPAHFLPENVDGRYLFQKANDRYFDNNDNKASDSDISLSNIVQVESVREGLKNHIFHDVRPFKEFYKDGVIWEDGTKEEIDVVVWCTGFKANLKHLEPLNIIENKRIATEYTRSIKELGLWLVGYGDWTGYASATIYGVGKTAKQTVKEVSVYLEE